MALVTKCDRCRLTEVSVTKVGAYDLCVACVAGFKDWVELGQVHAEASAPRAGHGQRWMVVEAIVATHGHVTPKLLAAATGMEHRSAGWYLQNNVKHGKLVAHGRAVFTLAQRNVAAE